MRCLSCGREIPGGREACPFCRPTPPAGPGAAVLGVIGLLCGAFLGFIFGGIRGGVVVGVLGLVLCAGAAAITNTLKGR